MKKINAEQPIGIFDSGVGGLTVAKAVAEVLPNESIIYFGDTAHLPYGDKSQQAIQGYTIRIVDFLLGKGAKAILIACHSASAAAYDVLKNYIGDRALLINVIDPVLQLLEEKYAGKSIGLIGTKFTVWSQIYQRRIAALDANIVFQALSTPLLVPIIEEGLFKHQVIDLVLAEYLSRFSLQNIDALILGCTHYPIIKQAITRFFQGKIDIIDSAQAAAITLKELLTEQQLLADNIKTSRKFYVSDYTPAFAELAKMFFGEGINLELYNQ
ncbi:MAG: glutamate racemase [Gammaproteobacteria bacterium]|nr:glutamate racemase [Gammaproteobacteria bacterium]